MKISNKIVGFLQTDIQPDDSPAEIFPAVCKIGISHRQRGDSSPTISGFEQPQSINEVVNVCRGKYVFEYN